MRVMDRLELEIKKRIKEILNVSSEAVVSQAELVSDLGADSLDLLELVLALEERYGFEVPDEKAAELITVGQVIDYIRENEGQTIAPAIKRAR